MAGRQALVPVGKRPRHSEMLGLGRLGGSFDSITPPILLTCKVRGGYFSRHTKFMQNVSFSLHSYQQEWLCPIPDGQPHRACFNSLMDPGLEFDVA